MNSYLVTEKAGTSNEWVMWVQKWHDRCKMIDRISFSLLHCLSAAAAAAAEREREGRMWLLLSDWMWSHGTAHHQPELSAALGIDWSLVLCNHCLVRCGGTVLIAHHSPHLREEWAKTKHRLHCLARVTSCCQLLYCLWNKKKKRGRGMGAGGHSPFV